MPTPSAISFAALFRSLSIASLLFTFSSTSAGEPVAVEPGKRWKVNDEVRYDRVRSRTDSKVAKPIAARTPLTVKVIEAREAGYVISWKYGRTQVQGATPEMSEPLETLQNLLENVEYVIELDRSGEMKSLRNWEKVRDRVLAAVDKMPAQSKTTGTAQSQVVAQIKQLFSSKENVERYLLREVQLFFMFYGRRLDPGEQSTYADYLPNPLGGPPLPAQATVKLESADKSKATLRYTLAFDRDKSGKLLVDALAALATRMGKPLPASEAEAIKTSLDIKDEAELVFDLASRWPTRLAHERTIKLQDRSRVDRVEYERRR